MKAFICLALVACVAARNLDIDGLRLLKEQSLLKDELLSKNLHHRFQLPQKSLLGLESGLDTVREWGQDVNSWDERRVAVYSFEEIVQTNLFQSYYQIPLFRQYLTQYPVIFRRYIESPMFQDLWKFQQFQQYFRNPVLFYKYIVPQVQIFAQTQEGIFEHEYPTYNFERRNTFGQENLVDQYLNRNVESREVVVGDYLNKILKGIQHGNQYQTGYGYNTIVPYTTRYAHAYGRDVATPINHKFLLDKIYRTLFLNKPVQGEVTQVKTDVKITPAHEKLAVDQITGETKVVIQEPKIVDVKVDEKVIPQHQAVSEIEREVLIKDILLKKLVVSKRISYELYTILKTLPLAHVKEVVRKHLGEYEYVQLINEIETPFMTRRELVQREIETPFMTRDMESTPFMTRHVSPFVTRRHMSPFMTRDVSPFMTRHVAPFMTRDVEETIPFMTRHVSPFMTRHMSPFMTRDVETTPFMTRHVAPFMTRDVEETTPFAFRGLNHFNHQQQNINELYNNEIVGDRVVPVLRELGHQIRV